jgi:tetratricopeptide (TPR) repeat protein
MKLPAFMRWQTVVLIIATVAVCLGIFHWHSGRQDQKRQQLIETSVHAELAEAKRLCGEAWQMLRDASVRAMRANNMDEAKQLCNEAMKLAGKFGPTDMRPAQSQMLMAELYRWEGKHDLAEQTFKDAIALGEKAGGPNHPDMVMLLDHLANFYYFTRVRYDQVALLYQRMANIVESSPELDDTELAWRTLNLGIVYQRMGQYAQAEPFFKRALALGEKENYDVPHFLLSMATFYREWGKYDQAEPLAKRALVIQEKKAAAPDAGPDPQLNMGLCLDGLADIYLAWGKYEQAETLYHRSVAIIEKFESGGADSPALPLRLTSLAEVLRAQGKYDEAETQYKRALTVTEKCLGPDFPEIAAILEKYAPLLNDMNRPEEAEALLNRAETIRKHAAIEE